MVRRQTSRRSQSNYEKGWLHTHLTNGLKEATSSEGPSGRKDECGLSPKGRIIPGSRTGSAKGKNGKGHRHLGNGKKLGANKSGNKKTDVQSNKIS